MRFYCVSDGTPGETISLLRTACESREVSFHDIDATRFAFDGDAGLSAGDALYCPAVSSAAARVEQFLWHDRVATFYADPLGPFFSTLGYPLLFQHAGLPIPRSIPIVTPDREGLRAAVQAVGGLPAIVKLLGWEGGVGTLRVDSLPALFSAIDYILAQGQRPFLCAYIDDAVHWRAIVVGSRVVAAYRNVLRADDFLSFAGDDAADYTSEPPGRVADVAILAVQALRLQFGGVDILEHPSGRVYLLEANFPCYFAHAQTTGGIDVAGAMVEHLLQRSRAITETIAAS